MATSALRVQVVDLGYGRKERRLYRGPVLVDRRPIEAPGEKPVAQTVRARGRARGSL